MGDRTAVIFGGSGFLGRGLARHLLERGSDVIIVSRSDPRLAGVRHCVWDGRTVGEWASVLAGAHAIVNLAGRTVDCIKTPDHCDEILRSRVESTLAIGDALRQTGARPRVWVQMSTAHIFGDPPNEVCDESSALGYGLAPTVGRAWESAFADSCPVGVRRVVLRTSFVLGRTGGAVPRLAKLCRWGLGGRVGSGRQGMSWIHELDMHRIMDRAIDDDRMQGVYIATAPNPVSNAEFMRELRRVAGGLGSLGIAPPAFEWMVRIGAPLLMRTDPELAIYGRYCVPRRMMEEGFRFEHAQLSGALAHVFA